MVPGTGIEPVRFIQPQDFKSCASTYSATWARCLVTRRRFELRTPWLKVKCSTGWASESTLAGVGGIEPPRWQSQSLLPYLLATPQLVVEGGRFEPPNPKELIYSQPRLASSLPLHVWYSSRIVWWMLRGLNSRPPPCKGDALPAELSIRFCRYASNNIPLCPS